MKPAVWECEWCGETKKINAFLALFKWVLPRFCPITGEYAGWEHPSCRLSHALAMRIAERAAKKVYDQAMQENKGMELGKLRRHELIQTSNTMRSRSILVSRIQSQYVKDDTH